MKILITGASSGIGRATAALLYREGHDLLLGARRTPLLNDLGKELRAEKSRFLVGALDVTQTRSIKSFIETHRDWLEGVDVLINNAGLALGIEGFQDSNPNDFKTMVDTNVTGLLEVTRAILPFMLKHKAGHIVNMGSVAGRTAYAGGSVYCATKAAVHILTDALRIDLNGTGIRVSTIAPGRVSETEFSIVRFKKDIEKAKRLYQGFRNLTASEVAETIHWVISRPAHINIQELTILPTDQASATMPPKTPS